MGYIGEKDAIDPSLLAYGDWLRAAPFTQNSKFVGGRSGGRGFRPKLPLMASSNLSSQASRQFGRGGVKGILGITSGGQMNFKDGAEFPGLVEKSCLLDR